MSKHLHNCCIFVLLSLLLCACREEREAMRDSFIGLNEIVHLEIGGKTLFSYNEDLCQLSYNENKNEYRVFYSDNRQNDLSSYFIVTLDSRPVKDENIRATVAWTEEKRLVTKKIKFEVLNCTADGRTWLWNSSEAIGIIIKSL